VTLTVAQSEIVRDVGDRARCLWSNDPIFASRKVNFFIQMCVLPVMKIGGWAERSVKRRLDGGGIIALSVPNSAKILDVYDLSDPIRHRARRGGASRREGESCKTCIG